MSWSSFWYHLCAIPLEVRTVSLVLCLEASAVLSVLPCLPAVRHADGVFSQAVYGNNRAASQLSYGGVYVTPTPPPPFTSATLDKTAWILVLHPLPLPALPLPD